MSRTNEKERFEARISREQKELLREAAELRGQTLTDFVMSMAQEGAQRTIEMARLIQLSARDQERFVDALLNPPEPNDALKSAAAAYNSGISEKLRRR